VTIAAPPREGPGATPGPFDVVVLGSGVAGLSAAVRVAAGPGTKGSRVCILTKGLLSETATTWAQGGVAAAIGGEEDSVELHLADTLAAGANLCDIDAARTLVEEGPLRVKELISMGATFDREESGTLALAREGGHSRARVVHAGGAATGAEIERALAAAVRGLAVTILEGWFALDLVVRAQACRGVRALAPDGHVVEIRADHVVLATGGAGQLYAVTTNPAEATGDGIAMALRAGVPVADIEFLQFHPTALHHPATPRPLLSEALRGAGAVLRDARGARFVDELAPRDVVSRAMAQRMLAQGVEHLWLDATGIESFASRYPTIAAVLARVGLDPSHDWLPVAPAAHHLSGGVVTDLFGATLLPGLWAAGEVACTGVHGANRLASNSLLEGLVFGARLAERIADGHAAPSATGAMRMLLTARSKAMPLRPDEVPPVPARAAPRVAPVSAGPTARAWASAGGPGGHAVECPGPLRGAGSSRQAGAKNPVGERKAYLAHAMTTGAGVIREASSLEEVAAVVEKVAGSLCEVDAMHQEASELANVVAVARALVASAMTREESRGAHTRVDFARTDPSWRCRLVHGDLGAEGVE